MLSDSDTVVGSYCKFMITNMYPIITCSPIIFFRAFYYPQESLRSRARFCATAMYRGVR